MTITLRWLITFSLLVGVACGPTTPEPLPERDTCEPGPSNEFEIGVVVPDDPRWFRAFEEGCDTIELDTGLQGGWHLEPAMQAPVDAVSDDLAGQLVWEVRADGDSVARAEVEMFKSFWQPLEGGLAYWGDFVIFYSNPEDLVGEELEIELTITFAAESPLDEVVLREMVLLVDEEEETGF